MRLQGPLLIGRTPLAAACAVIVLAACAKSAHVETSTLTPSPLYFASGTSRPESRPAPIRFSRLSTGVGRALTFLEPGHVPIWVVRVDPGAVRIKAIDVVTTVGNAFSYPTYSIREVFQVRRPQVIISGGNSPPASLPAPEGLLVVDGSTISRLNLTPEFATAVFCVSDAGIPRILHKTDRRLSTCRNALQSGPVFIEPTGRQGMSSEELDRPPYGRAAVGLDSTGMVYFVVTGDLHLWDLANELRKSARDGGLGLTVAMALGRNAGHAGMIYHDEARPNQLTAIGVVDSTLPSALMIMPR